MADPKVDASKSAPTVVASETATSRVPTKAPNVAVTKRNLEIRYGDKKTIIFTGFEVVGSSDSPDVKKYNDREKYVPITVTFEENTEGGKGKIVAKTLYVPQPASVLAALDELPYHAHKKLGLITGDTTSILRAQNPLKYTAQVLGTEDKGAKELTGAEKEKLVKEMTKHITGNPWEQVMLLKAQFYHAHRKELTAAQFDAIFREAERMALSS